MNKLESLCFYILEKEGDMSDMRLNLLVYLSDWANCVWYQEQITNKHYFYNFGTIRNDITDSLKRSPYFNITKTIKNMAVDRTEIKREKYVSAKIELSESEKNVVDNILKKYSEYYYNHLDHAVRSTFPLNEDTIYSELDLVKSSISLKKEALTD